MKLHLFSPGQMIAGKFKVERILAEGSTAIVLVAAHIGLGTSSVLKILHPQFAKHPDAVQRFMREARAVARLNNDHVVRILDVDALADGTPYMVMEHLDGVALDTLAKHGTLATAEVVDAMLQACSGVAEAHAAGVVHRDLKPANLFCTKSPDGSLCIKVLDFGVSKLTPKFEPDASATAATLSQGPEIFGSPAYMAPEQIDSAISVDERADVWALGAILYELLAGRRAFPGKTIAEVFLSIADETPEPLRVRSPEVPPELEAIVVRCLQKRRTDRFQTVRALAEALADFAGVDEVVPSTRRPLVIVTKPVPLPTPMRLPIDRNISVGRSNTSMAGWIVAAVAVAAMVGLVMARLAPMSAAVEPPATVRVTSAVMPVTPSVASTPAAAAPVPAPAPAPAPVAAPVPPIPEKTVVQAQVVGSTVAAAPRRAPAPARVQSPAPHRPAVTVANTSTATAAPTPTPTSTPDAIVPADYAPFGGRK